VTTAIHSGNSIDFGLTGSDKSPGKNEMNSVAVFSRIAVPLSTKDPLKYQLLNVPYYILLWQQKRGNANKNEHKNIFL
jgi:hypothetical protein